LVSSGGRVGEDDGQRKHPTRLRRCERPLTEIAGLMECRRAAIARVGRVNPNWHSPSKPNSVALTWQLDFHIACQSRQSDRHCEL